MTTSLNCNVAPSCDWVYIKHTYCKHRKIFGHPLYNRGDRLAVGLVRTTNGYWLVEARNETGQRVEGIVNRSFEYSLARRKAHLFAESL